MKLLREINWGLIAGVGFSILVWAIVFYVALVSVTGGWGC